MGVKILNKDVSVISSIGGIAKANISNVGGIGGWVSAPTWTLNFNDINVSGLFGQTNIQTIPETSTLYFELTIIGGGVNWTVYNITTDDPNMYSSDFITNTTLNFNINDEIQLTFSATYFDGAVTIKQNNSSGRQIDYFTVFVAD